MVCFKEREALVNDEVVLGAQDAAYQNTFRNLASEEQAVCAEACSISMVRM